MGKSQVASSHRLDCRLRLLRLRPLDPPQVCLTLEVTHCDQVQARKIWSDDMLKRGFSTHLAGM